jgi:hypothetical protein
MMVPVATLVRPLHVRRPGWRPLVLAAALVASAASTLSAQTDFYNTSPGRPVRVEDAVPVEYRAVELNVAPVRLDLLSQDTRFWSLLPEATI